MPPKQTAPMASTTGPKPKQSRPTFWKVKPSSVISSSTASNQVPIDGSSQPQPSKPNQPKFQAVKSLDKQSEAISGGTEVITLGTTAKGHCNYCMQHFCWLRSILIL